MFQMNINKLSGRYLSHVHCFNIHINNNELTLTIINDDHKTLINHIYKYHQDSRMKDREDIELKKEIEELEAIFNLSEDMICIADINGYFKKINPAFKKILGYSDKELMGKPFLDFIHPDDIDKTLDVITTQLAKGYTVSNFENRYKCKDGTFKYLSWVSRPEPEKGITYAIARDITGIKKEKDKYLDLLQKSHDTFKIVMDSLNAVVYVADMNTYEVLFTNKYTKNNIGDIEGKICWQSIQTGQTGPCDFCTNDKLLTPDGKPNGVYRWEFENTVNGRWYDIHDSAIDWVDGRIARLEIATDITDRKKAEDALKTNEEKFRLLFTGQRDAIVLVDAETKRIVDVNDSALHLYGYSRQEILKLCGPDISADPEASTAAINEIAEITDKDIHYYTRLHKKKDGTVFPVEISSGHFILHDKSIVSAMIRDITERKELEEQLRQAQKMEAVGQLAGGVAHDFNNILGAIMNYGYLLKNKLDNDEHTRMVFHILESTEKAAKLTSNLLAFSRKQMLQITLVNLNEIIERVENLMTRIIGEQIKIKTILAKKAPIIMADSTQIEQVLTNIITNAGDAMPEGGVLTVETEYIQIDDAYIRMHGYGKAGKYAVVSISDTGIGMDKTIRDQIFEPFFTTKEVGKGTGLGLSMSYGIIKQHNGYINVYSEKEQGTTIKIYLPLIGGEAEEQRSAVSDTKIKGTETVLLAEDNAELRIGTKQILEASGYKVIEAVDGEDAIGKFKENIDSIGLLLFDVVMPEKSGKKAYDEIRKVSPDIKVLFMSGYSEGSILKNEVLKEGLNFISKPVAPNVLLKKIIEVLNN